MQDAAEELGTLEGLRDAFTARFRDGSRGYHALGELVMDRYFEDGNQFAKPVSAMTFRNFLQGRTTVRDPNGLLLYFECLGASGDEMQSIRATLQQAVDRKLAAPGHQSALAAFREGDLESMPYSRALAECEAATRFEESTSTPIAAVSPSHYLLGPSGRRDAGPDRNAWGLLQHMGALQRFLTDLELKLQDAFAEAPPRAKRKRKWLAAAAVREAGDAYSSYLLHNPALAELLLSRRRHILHGPMPEPERKAAIASIQRVFRTLYQVFERFAQEVILDGDAKLRCKTPDGEVALETIGERLMSAVHGFYLTTVLGSEGTGGVFAAMQQARREFASDGLPGGAAWSDDHEALVARNERALAGARELTEGNSRVRYGELRRLFEGGQAEHIEHCKRVWHQDFGGSLIRHTGTLVATELHTRKLLSDGEVVAFYKFFLTSARGRELHDACHEPQLYDLDASN